MRFNILLLLPLALASPSPQGGGLKELPNVDVVTLGNGISLYDLPHGQGGGVHARQSTRAICPPNYPLYCSAYNFCCPSQAIGCCPLACCAPGATFCQNGHCYGPARN